MGERQVEICWETDPTTAHGSVGCIRAGFWSFTVAQCSDLRLSHGAGREVSAGTSCRQLLLTTAWLSGCLLLVCRGLQPQSFLSERDVKLSWCASCWDVPLQQSSALPAANCSITENTSLNSCISNLVFLTMCTDYLKFCLLHTSRLPP